MRPRQNIGTKCRTALALWVDWEIPSHDPVVSMAIARQTVGALRLQRYVRPLLFTYPRTFAVQDSSTDLAFCATYQ